MSFSKAFADARKAGKKVFTYNGKKYHTRTKEEEDKRKAATKPVKTSGTLKKKKMPTKTKVESPLPKKRSKMAENYAAGRKAKKDGYGAPGSKYTSSDSTKPKPKPKSPTTRGSNARKATRAAAAKSITAPKSTTAPKKTSRGRGRRRAGRG